MIISLLLMACTPAIYAQIKSDQEKSAAIQQALSDRVSSGQAPGINRAYVVATNSRDFSTTEEMCAQLINQLVKMDLGIK